MRKRTIIVILLALVALIIGGGFIFWRLKSKKPLDQLSDKELKKCLLEDFDRRLELERYFIFNLQKEVQTKKAFFNNKPVANSRIIKDTLSSDLTKLTNYLLVNKKIKKEIDTTNYKKMTKGAVTFCGKDIDTVSDEWSGESLDKKIVNEEQWYIIFDKSKIDDERAFFTTVSENGQDTNKLAWNGHVIVEIENPGNHVAKSKSEALNFLKKNDPALSK